MEIYLVVRGFYEQGYSVLSAHDDFADAIEHAKAETLDGAYMSIVQKSPTRWEDYAGDYVEVVELTLSQKKGG